MSLVSVDDAYSAIAREILAFVGDRPWDSATGIYEVLAASTSGKWSLSVGEEEVREGAFPPNDVALLASDGALFLRDNVLTNSGQRIWGLKFTLFPDGRFRIEYDYAKPEGYEDTDETIDVDLLKGVLGQDGA
jgi:hypothetical protein